MNAAPRRSGHSFLFDRRARKYLAAETLTALSLNRLCCCLLVGIAHVTAVAADALRLEPVCARITNGVQVFLAGTQACARAEAAFFAVVADEEWPAGLVPVFAIEAENRFELRRFPARGTEPSAEPLFFALPRADEPHASEVAGRWSVTATNAQKSRHYFEWELAIEGERVAGRFSPQSEFRVAYITGGVFRSNRLELHAEYFQDRYTLLGELREGRFSGTWRHDEDADRGTWSAVRTPSANRPRVTGTVALYEWRRGKERRYGMAAPEGEGWERAEKALCRVWMGTNTKSQIPNPK